VNTKKRKVENEELYVYNIFKGNVSVGYNVITTLSSKEEAERFINFLPERVRSNNYIMDHYIHIERIKVHKKAEDAVTALKNNPLKI
jgi:hypothetical protein